ncbi:MAG: lysophospholipid acyltransferase family protein [Candidatus Pacearchaeota archaeon]
MLIAAIQYIYYFLFHYPLKIILNQEITVPKNLKLKKSVLIIANHRSRTDPFLLAQLPFSLFKKLAPVYFPTAEKYHKNIFLSFLLKSVGSYPIKRWGWSFDDIFDRTIRDLRNGKTTLIFPEGQIVRKGEKVKAKIGFLYLASKVNATILPIKLERKNNKTIIKVGRTIRYFNKKITKKEANRIMKNLYEM